MGQPTSRILAVAAGDYRLAWRELLLTDLAWKAIAFVVLTPLVSLFLRIALAVSGAPALADQDILYFLLGPAGWITLILVGAAWIAIAALEQAALMTVLAVALQGRRPTVRGALVRTASLAWPVLQVAGRIVALGAAAAAPFLLAVGGVYVLLLGKHDINYYLAEKPPVFWIASGLAAAILAGLAAVLLRVLVPALYALPLLLFEGADPREALRTSRQATAPHLRRAGLWMLGWLGATAALSAAVSALLGLTAQLLLPLLTHSLGTALLGVGLLLIAWSVAQMGLSLVGATTLAVLVVTLYRQLGGAQLALSSAPIPDPGPQRRFFSRRSFLLASGAGIAVAATVGAVALHGVQATDRTWVIAHRGGASAAPENSMAAIGQAIVARADWVEIDVQESSDGVVLVAHDEDLKKAAGADLKIWASTAEQIGAVDIGIRHSPQFADQRVPTLEQVLRACKGKVGVTIELKYYGHDQRLEQRVIDLVEAEGMEGQVMIMSLKYDGIRKFRSLRPAWKVGLLSAVAVGDLTKVDADFLAVSTRIASRSFLRSARRGGKEVDVWTVNDPVTMSTMIGRGVRGLITDDPAVARRVLAERAQLGSLERLLLEVAVLFRTATPTDGDDA
ncbi:MAG: glycerophosphodiester phosphodiesterase family protein [Thermoguttaceae bacterium]